MAKQHLEALRKTLSEHGQEHVLGFWPDLAEGARRKLSKQLGGLDLDLLDRLVRGEGVFEPDPDPSAIDEPEVVTLPATDGDLARLRAAREVGLEEMHAGRVAAPAVAAGQGTRLGFDGPKGAGRPIPWYIMTSEGNDKATRAFLRKHKHFGLDPEDVFIFTQGMLPAADGEGRMFLAEPGRVFTAPNGHGGTLSALADSGALEDMTSRGIEHVYYFQVDNPLVPVPDPVFIGHHVEAGAEMSSKVLRKRSPEEPIGTVVRREGRPVVIEYSDIPPEVQDAVTAEGDMRYPWGSIAIHVISVGFVRRFMDDGLALPFHRARKQIPHVDAEGQLVIPEEPNGTKFEMFIFDALHFAKASVTMEVAREDEFAPVKNASGKDSVATSRAALSDLYARWLETAGVAVEREADGAVAGALEISPLTADSAEALKGNLPPETEFRDGLAL